MVCVPVRAGPGVKAISTHTCEVLNASCMHVCTLASTWHAGMCPQVNVGCTCGRRPWAHTDAAPLRDTVCTPPLSLQASRGIKGASGTGERLALQGPSGEDRKTLASKWQPQPYTSLRGGPAHIPRELRLDSARPSWVIDVLQGRLPSVGKETGGGGCNCFPWPRPPGPTGPLPWHQEASTLVGDL